VSKSIVLFSGGMDSTTLLWTLRPSVKALLVDYGQRHAKELSYAKRLCLDYGIEFQIADLTGINHLIRKGSQSGDEIPPEGHYSEMSMKTTIVPNRNMIMLSVACGWAIATDCVDVYFAAHAGDHTIYPDCRSPFVDAFRYAVQLANGWNNINIHAPFINMSKSDIVKVASELGAPLNATWSCYVGVNKHCGKCGTCVERKEAFQLAGVEHYTSYAS
jgi:7-cyano-7-deazaguanine synthase